MQVVVCLCAQITSGTSVVWHFIEYQRQDLSSDLWSCFTVHSSRFSPGKITPGTSSFRFTFSCFFPFDSTFRFPILSSFNRAERFQFAFHHVCLHSRPTPRQSHKRARAKFGSQSLFSEVSYLGITNSACSDQQHFLIRMRAYVLDLWEWAQLKATLDVC